jgi:hypothetical protein
MGGVITKGVLYQLTAAAEKTCEHLHRTWVQSSNGNFIATLAKLAVCIFFRNIIFTPVKSAYYGTCVPNTSQVKTSISGGQNNEFEISDLYHCALSTENIFCSSRKICFFAHSTIRKHGNNLIQCVLCKVCGQAEKS